MTEIKSALSNIDLVWDLNSLMEKIDCLSDVEKNQARVLIDNTLSVLEQECIKRMGYAENSGAAAFQLEVVQRNSYTLKKLVKACV